MPIARWISAAFMSLLPAVLAPPCAAQVPPTAEEVARYTGLHAAAASGDVGQIDKLLAGGANPNAKDSHGRTPLHVAAHFSRLDAARALVKGRADPRALDSQRYDAITIAAVKDDVPMLKLAIELGGDPKAITSPYDGTALIAAAHLGHDEVVRTLIAAGSPLDHVNNLGWTAVIESIVLGDGGRRHQACLKALLDAKANPNIADRSGRTPLALAKGRDFKEMAALLEAAGGK
jgi:ankyrin repeat protein